LARQQRPGASHSPLVKRLTVIALPVSIMVVALPAWSLRSIHLQHCIHDFQRVLDEWIASLADAEAHQLEEARVDDLLGGIPVRISRTLVSHHQLATVGVLIATGPLRTVGRIDANIVPG